MIAGAFDPLSSASAMDALRTDLEQQLSGPAGRVTLTVIRLELTFVIAQARRWAIERGSRFDFVAPPPNCDAVDCILVLRRLASDLRELARRDGLRAVNDDGSSDEGDS